MNTSGFAINSAISTSYGELNLARVDHLVKRGVKLSTALARAGVGIRQYQKHLEDMELRGRRRLDGTPR